MLPQPGHCAVGGRAASARLSERLALNSPTDVTLSNVIKGSGSISKVGNSVLTLTGANTYTGGTTIEAGTLRWGGFGAFVQSTAYTVNGGTLDLGGFSLTASSFSGSGGTVALGSGRLTVNQSTNTSYAGIISGTTFGGLHKTGGGTLTLSGANTYSGTTQVSGGRLEVNGSLASAVVVWGGELGGTGTVGQTIISGGTLAPGNAGPFTVNDVLRLDWRSTYLVDVSSSGASRVNVSRSAHLDGAKVSARFAPGDYVSKQYNITSSTQTTVSGTDSPARPTPTCPPASRRP